jgi:hypothetical protein
VRGVEDGGGHAGALPARLDGAGAIALATLRSDGFFVDQVRGDPAAIAEALAASSRVAEFVRNSGTVEQRQMPGM